MNDNLHITMRQRPRRTGKTTELKLKILEEYHRKEFDNIFILTPFTVIRDEYARWLRNLRLANVYYIFQGMYSFEYITKNWDIEKILVIIDEPYIMDKGKQADIIRYLEELSCRMEVYVYGLGTKVEEKKSIEFRDFLEDSE